VEFCPEASSANANRVLAPGDAQQWRQKLVGVANLCDFGVAGAGAKVAAATIRIASIHDSASISAMVESI